jgi:WD40 repeat protein
MRFSKTAMPDMCQTTSILLWLCACAIHLACMHPERAGAVQSVAANRTTNHPILWTTDFSQDGTFFAVGGNDSLLRIYDAKTHKKLHSFNLSAAIQCVDWDSSSVLLAIALDNKSVQLLNIKTKQFQELKETSGSRALAWNKDGKHLAVGDYNGSLQIWNRAGELIRAIKKDSNKTYLSVDWHPTKPIILTGSDRIRIFDTSGNVLQSIRHRKEETPVLTVTWHPSGTFFASGDYGENENNIESLLQFWTEDGTLIRSLHGSKAEYRNMRWNKSGELLATASDALWLWSKEGKLIHSGNSEDLLWGIDWNSQGTNIITTSKTGSITLWTNKAELVKRVEN